MPDQQPPGPDIRAQLPLAEVASGAHDPKDLWPRVNSGPLAFLQLVGVLAVTVGQIVALGVLFVVPWTLWLWRGRTPPSARVIGYGTTLLTVLVLATLWSPWGQALTRWMLD